MSDGAAYVLEGVTFAYDGPVVLNVARAEVGRGEITALIGPNGSGKTTLLHLLGFLETPRTGRIVFLGEEASSGRARALRRRVAMVLQQPYLFRGTVRANVEWGLKVRGVGARERRRRAAEALERVGLAGFEERQARRLSGGETQRAALARALALQAEALLLDEPFAPMDPPGAARTEEVLLDLCRGSGTTVVFSTHDLLRGRALADRALGLAAGRLAPVGPANVFRGRVRPEAGCFDTGRIEIRLPAGVKSGTHASIDPDDVVLSREPLASSMRNTFHGRVAAVTDDEGRAWVEVDAGERFCVLITCESLRLLDVRPGEAVCLSFKSTAVKVF